MGNQVEGQKKPEKRDHHKNGGVDTIEEVPAHISAIPVTYRALLGQELVGHDVESTRSNDRIRLFILCWRTCALLNLTTGMSCYRRNRR